MAAHLGVTLLISTLLLLGGVALYARATTDQNLAAMLPDGPGSPQEAARLLSEFGALNTLLVDLEVPGSSEAQLADAGRTLAAALRTSPLVLEVYTGPSTRETLAVGQVLFPRRLYLLEDPAAEIERRLGPQRLKLELERLKRELASPQAIVAKQDVLLDPLGLNAELIGGFTRLAGDLRTSHGQLLSQDGHHLLLVVTPRKSALDARASSALLTAIAREASKLPVGAAGAASVVAVGGPRFAAESAAAVRKDVLVTLLTSIVALVLLFLFRFQNLRLLLLVSIPIVCGMVGGLAVVVLVQGHIQALSLAFGSVLLGVAIDYPLYLLNAASVHSGTALQRMSAGLEDSWRSLWLGFSTTLIAFLMLLLSPFPGLRELALFAGGGIVISFAATLILLVPLCAVWGPKRWSGIPRWMIGLQRWKLSPRAAVAVALGILLASVVLAPKLKFDGELRHLDAQRPQTLAAFSRVMDRFGLRGAGSLVVARGRTVEDALKVNDAVQNVLRRLPPEDVSAGTVGIGAFLPSVETQRARAKRLAALDVSRARARLSTAAVEAGFSPSAFDAFWAEVSAVQAGKVTPVMEADFTQTSLEPLLKRMLRCSPLECLVVTSIQPQAPQQLATLSGELPSGAVLFNTDALAEKTVARIPRQLALLSGVGLALNVVLLAFAYRSLRLAAIACLPGCLGLAGTMAILAAAQVPLNIASASALVLILGCGVDYGIFALQGLTDPSRVSGVESTGVVLTSLTALAGFGTLVLATYRALQSLGAAVGLGIILSSTAAIFLLPGLYGVLRPLARRVRPS